MLVYEEAKVVEDFVSLANLCTNCLRKCLHGYFEHTGSAPRA